MNESKTFLKIIIADKVVSVKYASCEWLHQMLGQQFVLLCNVYRLCETLWKRAVHSLSEAKDQILKTLCKEIRVNIKLQCKTTLDGYINEAAAESR